MLVFYLATDFATQLPSEGEMERWVLPAMSSGQRVTLLPNRWGLLAAIASMLAVPVWAEHFRRFAANRGIGRPCFDSFGEPTPLPRDRLVQMLEVFVVRLLCLL